MSSQKERIRELSSQQKTKDDYIHIRINSDIKDILRRFAKKSEKSLSQYILDIVVSVITSGNGVITPKTESVMTTGLEIKLATKQLISLFDKIFALDLPNSLKKKIRPILTETVDINLIEEVKEEL